MHDAIVIGSGAGAGPLTLVLARAGLDVLVLEKGPRFTRQDYARDGGLETGEFLPFLAAEPHTVLTRKTTRPVLTHLGWTATCVGGGTVHMGGYLYRFHPDDFRMLSRFGPYLELADWPFGYDELEPWYTRAEWEIGVAGEAGVDPYESRRSKPYPLPPLAPHPIAAMLQQACRRRGLHPFPTPRSINSRPYGGRPACAHCAVCAGLGCPVGARGSVQEALLPRAEATGQCRVETRAMVREITVDGNGRAAGCVWLDADGKEHEARAKIVCVGCSAVESARLLLLSKSPRFPDGLANNNGRVGRHLQFHGVSMGRGRFPADRPAGELLRDPHPFIGQSLRDWYFLPPGVSDIAKGGILRFGRMPQLPEAGQAAPPEGCLCFEVFHDFLPNAGTFVELDPQQRDRWGLPVARIHLDRPEHHVRAGRWLNSRAFELLDDLGAAAVEATDVGGTSAYLVHGTCRAGNDARTSVVDAWCQAHEVPNLFVVDGSFMPTSGGAPPTLTILANSFRVAERIVRRWRQGEFRRAARSRTSAAGPGDHQALQ